MLQAWLLTDSHRMKLITSRAGAVYHFDVLEFTQ